MSSSIPQKTCTKCRITFPATTDYFHRCPSNKDGLHSWCKGCKHGNGRRETCPEGMRCCKKCKQMFPATEEYFQRHTKTLRFVCRTCYREQRAQHYAENAESISLKSKQKYATNPEPAKARSRERYNRDPEADKAYSKAWRKAHPEARSAIGKRYYEKHKAQIREYERKHSLANKDRRREQSREWLKKNRDKSRAQRLNRIARLAKADGTHTGADRLSLYILQEKRCAYCGIALYIDMKRDTHIDHVIPLSKGGSNGVENLVLTCMFCNQSKGDKTLSEWYLTRGW